MKQKRFKDIINKVEYTVKKINKNYLSIQVRGKMPIS